MRNASRAAWLGFEDLLETVHCGQLRSSGLDEISWGLSAVKLSDDVCEATRFIHRSPLEDVPLEPVPRLFQIGGCSRQPRLIGAGNSELQLPAVEIQQHQRVRKRRLVLLGQVGYQQRDPVSEIHRLHTLACGNGVSDLPEAFLQ